MINKQTIIRDLQNLGIKRGDVLLVHSSFKSIGTSALSPDHIIECLIECIGETGTLLMPALSLRKQTENIHDTNHTPSNVGIIPERFRVAFHAMRSLHPTHSVCALGRHASELLFHHHLDRTPCGVHSPFRKLLFIKAKLLMLGCGLRPNTSMHAIEEIVGTPYLLGNERTYTITNSQGEVHDVIPGSWFLRLGAEI